ncbi:MAG: Trk system potassium transporter TrkA [Clostridiales bacterium]|nr:Trk system potassium transporter TrkA [Clostridiales bacterium]
MRIIIVGARKAAEILIEHLEKSNHDVIVIDKSKSTVEAITNRYSVNGICGSGASREVLISAGADTADVLLSLTPVDEINLLACSMAKSFGTRYTVAEVEREELISDKAYLRDKFGIDYILTRKDIVASAIADQVYFNSANRVEPFFDSNVLLAEIIVEKDSALSEARLQDVKPMLNSDFLVFGVLRGDKLMVPKGEFVLKPGDVIGIIADKAEMTKLFSRVDLVRKPVRSVMLVGGGEMGAALAEQLIRHRISVKLVERSRDRCEELLEELPKAKIIYGSGTDVELLEREGIGKCDACVCVTNSDETNLLTSLIAWTNGVNNIITTIRGASYDRVLRKVTINITVSPDRIVAEKLLDYLLSLETGGGKHSRYYSLGADMLKISAFDIPAGFSKTEMPLMNDEMRLKKGVLIVAITRGGDTIIPKGSDIIQCGDRIFVLSEGQIDIHSPLDIFS